MGIQHSHGKGIFAIVKRPKYLYHHPKPPATDHRLQPWAIAIRCHCPPPAAAADRPPSTSRGRHRPPSVAVVAAGQLVAITSIKGIFRNLSNIHENLICVPNTPKILYSRKLFSEIAFLGIIFPIIKIHSSTKRSLKGMGRLVCNNLFIFREC